MRQQFANWKFQRREEAVRRRPDNAKAWAQYYALATEQSRTGAVFQFCQQVIRNVPQNHNAWMFMQLAAGEGQQADRLTEFCRQMVLMHPDHPRAWGYLDLAYENEPARLLAFCREVVKLHPGNAPALTRLNRDFKKAGKYADMISTCLALIAAGKDDAQTWCNLGDAYSARMQFEEAIAAYEMALERRPNYVVVLNSLGNVYPTMGQHREAIELYKKSLKQNPHDATPWVWLCLAHIQNGDIGAARETVNEVKKRLPALVNMLNEEIAITSLAEVAHAKATGVA